MRIKAITAALLCAVTAHAKGDNGPMKLVPVENVKVADAFWTPRYDNWFKVTIPDVLNKFEGRGTGNNQGNTLDNFDQIASGIRNTGHHVGEPWFDGLVYETIRGVADMLKQRRDPAIEARIDMYVDKIAAAQASDKDGYLNTYTQLMYADKRWGEHGGLLRWQHDVYNLGALVEAGVHYYEATGKTKLLVAATRAANMMCGYMGEYPRHNVVPAHSLPEEAMVKLYWLYRDRPEAAKQVKAQGVNVDKNEYLRLATFWIEHRGVHCGYPQWGTIGNEAAERWIRDNKYTDPKYGNHSRPSFGPYAQDSLTLDRQNTIEGHAVRATLYMTGVTTAAIETHNPMYIAAARRLWDNMAGRRMFITGGVGAIAYDEKFGGDYFLPNDAYLETCAAVGVAFYSQRLNQLTCDARYMDEFERSLYNNVLTGISLAGDNYTYQNPLDGDHHGRWQWHGCPCCPPMFLKLVSAMPGFAYGYDKNSVYVNLFIGSQARIDDMKLSISQATAYPSNGQVAITINPDKSKTFTLKVRIPGWAVGKENPFGLYNSTPATRPILMVNGQEVETTIVNGYACIDRKWNKGDVVSLSLPVEPRYVTAHNAVNDLKGMTAIAAGPIVYSFEECDNKDVKHLKVDTKGKLAMNRTTQFGSPVNIVSGDGVDARGNKVTFRAVPYFAVGNRHKGEAYKVWAEESR
ncbi:MAG: glycoside hydrolase family 127 protein [Prevotella sp.]